MPNVYNNTTRRKFQVRNGQKNGLSDVDRILRLPLGVDPVGRIVFLNPAWVAKPNIFDESEMLDSI